MFVLEMDGLDVANTGIERLAVLDFLELCHPDVGAEQLLSGQDTSAISIRENIETTTVQYAEGDGEGARMVKNLLLQGGATPKVRSAQWGCRLVDSIATEACAIYHIVIKHKHRVVALYGMYTEESDEKLEKVGEEMEAWRAKVQTTIESIGRRPGASVTMPNTEMMKRSYRQTLRFRTWMISFCLVDKDKEETERRLTVLAMSTAKALSLANAEADGSWALERTPMLMYRRGSKHTKSADLAVFTLKRPESWEGAAKTHVIKLTSLADRQLGPVTTFRMSGKEKGSMMRLRTRAHGAGSFDIMDKHLCYGGLRDRTEHMGDEACYTWVMCTQKLKKVEDREKALCEELHREISRDKRIGSEASTCPGQVIDTMLSGGTVVFCTQHGCRGGMRSCRVARMAGPKGITLPTVLADKLRANWQSKEETKKSGAPGSKRAKPADERTALERLCGALDADGNAGTSGEKKKALHKPCDYCSNDESTNRVSEQHPEQAYCQGCWDIWDANEEEEEEVLDEGNLGDAPPVAATAMEATSEQPPSQRASRSASRKSSQMASPLVGSNLAKGRGEKRPQLEISGAQEQAGPAASADQEMWPTPNEATTQQEERAETRERERSNSAGPGGDRSRAKGGKKRNSKE